MAAARCHLYPFDAAWLQKRTRFDYRTTMFWAAILVATSPIVESQLPAPASIDRVVSLAPTVSEIVCALSACSRLVGVTRFDDYPQQLKTVAKVGGFVD